MPKPPVAPEVTRRNIPARAAIGFRNRLRAARAAALADGEGYLELIFAIEEIGGFVTNNPRATGLGSYAASLTALAVEASVATAAFPSLLDALREARNDIAHIGAAARRTTSQAIDVAVILEDALANHAKLKLVEHYMVSNPVCAEAWQTVSMVRAIMLRSQFSTLPLLRGKTWHVLTDSAVVRFLASERTVRLNTTVADALSQETGRLATEPAETVRLGDLVDPLRNADELRSYLVVDDAQNLCGILTPFDLL